MGKPKTFFVDIDGTLLEREESLRDSVRKNPELTKGSAEFLQECRAEGDQVILITGRPECFRSVTLQQLDELKVPYDQLIMGLNPGARIVINDGENRAAGVCCYVNEGFTDELDEALSTITEEDDDDDTDESGGED